MKLALNILRVKLDDLGFVVLWEPVEDMPIADKLEKVCLSRLKGGKCEFKIDEFADHNSHTPKFNDVKGVDEYIARVIADTKAICECNGISFEPKINEVMAPSGGSGGGKGNLGGGGLQGFSLN